MRARIDVGIRDARFRARGGWLLALALAGPCTAAAAERTGAGVSPRVSVEAVGVAAAPAESRAPAAASSVAPAARRLVVDAIGDSITAGYARSGDSQGRGAEMDPDGGYPGRLRSLLEGDLDVRQRGAGGSTLETWTGVPRGDPAALEALLRSLWPDLPTRVRAPRPRQTALAWTLEADRPDVVILLLGVNDLWIETLHGGPPDARGAAARAARAAATARATGARVLVATLPANLRDSSGAIEEFNRRLCELEPDCIRLDVEFAKAGGSALLGDEIHPSPAGHQAIAETMADALVRAGIARRREPPPGTRPAAGPPGAPLPGPSAGAPR